MTRLEDSGFSILCRAEAPPSVATGAVDVASFAWKAIWPFAFVGVAIGAVLVQRKLIERDSLESALFELNRGDEKKALGIVYQQTFDKLTKKASFFTRNEDVALESVQEMFIPGGQMSYRLQQLKDGELTADNFTTAVLGDIKNNIRSIEKSDRGQEREKPVPLSNEEALAHWRATPAIIMEGVRYLPVPEVMPDGSAIVRFTSADGKVAITRAYARPSKRGDKRRIMVEMPKNDEGVDLDVSGASPTDYVEKAFELEQTLRRVGLSPEQMEEVRDEISGLKEAGVQAILFEKPGITLKQASKEYERRLQEVTSANAREGELSRSDLEGVMNYLEVSHSYERLALEAQEKGDDARAEKLLASLVTLQDVQERKLGVAGLARAVEIAKRALDERRPKYGPEAPTRDFSLLPIEEQRKDAIARLSKELAGDLPGVKIDDVNMEYAIKELRHQYDEREKALTSLREKMLEVDRTEPKSEAAVMARARYDSAKYLLDERKKLLDSVYNTVPSPNERHRVLRKIFQQLSDTESLSMTTRLGLEENQKLYQELTSQAQMLRAIEKDIVARKKGDHVTYKGSTLSRGVALSRVSSDYKKVAKLLKDQKELIDSLVGRSPRVEVERERLEKSLPENVLEEIEKIRDRQEQRMAGANVVRRD